MTSLAWLHPVSGKERPPQKSLGWILGPLPPTVLCAFRCFTIDSLCWKWNHMYLSPRLLVCTVQVRQLLAALWRWPSILMCDTVTIELAAVPRILLMQGERALLKEMRWKSTLCWSGCRRQSSKEENQTALLFILEKMRKRQWEEGKTVDSWVPCGEKQPVTNPWRESVQRSFKCKHV